MARLNRALEYLRQSLWFVPSIFAVAAVISAIVLMEVDRRLTAEGADVPFLFGGGADGARAMLSTIATSMLTFTGLVFTVTMLVLQLASTQLSPRVLRTFLRDRGNQIVLGLFVATFLYTLVVLRYVRAEDGEAAEFVPGSSIGVAFVLLLASVGAFIYYINHMAQSIRASSVIHSIAAEARDALERLFPEEVGESAGGPAAVDASRPAGRPTATLGADGPGVLVALDQGALIRAVRGETDDSASGRRSGNDRFVELVPMVGDYVPEGAPMFRLWGEWDEHEVEALQRSATFGTERSVDEDLGFGFRQLVDIAIRALSKGVNDPTTAVQAMDRIHDLLRRLARRQIPSPIRRDPDGQARLLLARPEWEDYVVLATEEIRLAGEDQLQVMRRLRLMLRDILTVAPPERQAPVRRALGRLDKSVERALADKTDERFTSAVEAPGQGRMDV